MKLEDIRNMSDEEFITYINKFKSEPIEISPEEALRANKKIVNVGTIFNGLAFGAISVSILDHFTDDILVLGASYVIGAIVGIPIANKAFKLLYTKLENDMNESKQQELIDLKNNLENLSESELSFLININKNNNIYGLYERISEIFNDDDPNKFIDSLEVTYKDDEEKLGYSKNITTNN